MAIAYVFGIINFIVFAIEAIEFADCVMKDLKSVICPALFFKRPIQLAFKLLYLYPWVGFICSMPFFYPKPYRDRLKALLCL